MNILSFMWKNFNSESNPMGKRPYGVFIALFTLLGFMVVSLYYIYDNISNLFPFFNRTSNTLIIYYEAFGGIFIVSLLFLFCTFGFIIIFFGIFLGKKWYYNLGKIITFLPAKIACYFTKVNYDEAFPRWEIRAQEGFDTRAPKWFTFHKPKNKIEKCRLITAKIYLFSFITYMLFFILCTCLSDKIQFNLTKNFILNNTEYKYCYGFDDNPILYPDEKNKHHYMITFALKEIACPAPEEKYRPYAFTQFPS